jgi:hypothetical protein
VGSSSTGIGHVSLDNYIAQVSGQSPNMATSSDCIGSGASYDVTPGTLDATTRHESAVTWREYGEDMGNDPACDNGTTDALGGTD